MRINWGKIKRVFFLDNTCQYQGSIYNIRTTSNIKKKRKGVWNFTSPCSNLFKKFYNKINLCWYFRREDSRFKCTFCIGWGLNMSRFNVLVASLNLKIQKDFTSHHIWIRSLTILSNLQIRICLKFLVLNTGFIPWIQPLKPAFFQS